MILMILGASNIQVNAIKYTNSLGYTSLITDYNDNPPGKRYASYHEKASTFDFHKTLEVALKYKINGILTLGTDQPVLTVTKVANELKLPTALSIDTAYKVTNKKAMKSLFSLENIPTVPYKIIEKDFKDIELKDLSFPVVIKPLDSQGQRGIYLLNTIDEIRHYFDNVLEYSREKEILVESYYPSDEITISGWVNRGKAKIITITDRIRFTEEDKIGICLSHEFPSKYMNIYNELEILTNNIVKVFNINNGPIYFQFLIGEEGIKVNEIACRIGGAYEDLTIPLVTNINILDMLISYSLFGEIGDIPQKRINKYNIFDKKKCFSTQLFFLKEGKVSYITPEDKVRLVKGLHSFGLNINLNDDIKKIENATTRAGYAILVGENKKDLENSIQEFYRTLQILDENNQDMIIHS